LGHRTCYGLRLAGAEERLELHRVSKTLVDPPQYEGLLRIGLNMEEMSLIGSFKCVFVTLLFNEVTDVFLIPVKINALWG
jgi:hypothetical protein